MKNKFIRFVCDTGSSNIFFTEKLTLVTDSEYLKLKEIISKMPKTEDRNSISYGTKDLGSDDTETSDYNYITYEEKQFLGQYLPIGDSWLEGIISIEGISLLSLEETLF